MSIPVKPEKVRLTINASTVSSTQTNVHDYDIDKLFEERAWNSYELQFYVSNNVIPFYSSDYIFTFNNYKPESILFYYRDSSNVRKYIVIKKGGSVLVGNEALPSSWMNDVNSIAQYTVQDYLATDGLSQNTYTVGYSSERLCVEFFDEDQGSFLFSVWAVGDTTGNAEQVFCTKVPNKNFLAKSTPSLFTVTQDSTNTNLYYIACKTSGYTTTLNVTKIIDTTNGSVGLYLEGTG